MAKQKSDEHTKKFKNEFRPMLAASSVGIVFVVSILLGTLLGIWLDKQFNTKPYLTVIFIILGVVSGFHNMYIFIKRAGLLEEHGKQNEHHNKD